MVNGCETWRVVLGFAILGALTVGLFVWHAFFETIRHDD